MKENTKWGKLTTVTKVQKSYRKKNINAKWLCKCDCGNEKIVFEPNLYKGDTKSCGCLDFKNKKTYDRKDYFDVLKKRIADRIFVDENGCWIWQGSRHRQGYGNIRFNKKHGLLHRVVWEINNGKIPEGIKVCHKCDVPSCCNLEHLFLGTQRENVYDAIVKGRYGGRKIGKRRNKLNFEQVQEIKRLNGDGMSRKELQKKYKVGQTCIAKILTGTSWLINWTQEL